MIFQANESIGTCPPQKTECPYQAYALLTGACCHLFTEGICPEIIGVYPDEDLVIASGLGNLPLARGVADRYMQMYGSQRELCCTMSSPNSIFPDGERHPVFPEELLPYGLRGKIVFIIQSFTPQRYMENGEIDLSTGVNELFVELLLMVDAAKRANAAEIHVVIPYCPYLRSDRKELSGEPVAARLLLSTLENLGANTISTLDPHNKQAVFNSVGIPGNVVHTSVLFQQVIRKLYPDYRKLYFAAPDAGAVRMARKYAEAVLADTGINPDSRLVFMFKGRDAITGATNSQGSTGVISGSHILLVDDMAATCGTLVQQAEQALAQGASRVTALAVHGLFLGDAIKRIEESGIDRLITTNTVEQPPQVLKSKKIFVVDTAPLLAEVIHCVLTGIRQTPLFVV